MNELLLKQKNLETDLKKNDSLAVAFSGGVDSSFLLAAAKSALTGNRRLVAVTAVSPVHPERDILRAQLFAEKNNIRHVVVHSEEMKSKAFLSNTADRCYVCKKIIFQQILGVARAMGIQSVAHGVNADDAKEYRPGIKAAEELNILAPLLAAALTKNDIRQLSLKMGLDTWDLPSSGCLATRIPYGESITRQKLKMVEAGEVVLETLGFKTCRIRHYGEMAKIEVPEDDITRLVKSSVRKSLTAELKKIGFLYVSIDLEGHQSGRLNRSVASE